MSSGDQVRVELPRECRSVPGPARQCSSASAALPLPGRLPRLSHPMLPPTRNNALPPQPNRSSIRPSLAVALRALLPALLTLGALSNPPAAAAAALRVVASDARGVTLQVTVGAWTLSAPGHDGRVHVTGLSGAHELAEPGRPMLPAWSATLALPPDARPSARVLESAGELAREGVRMTIAGKPGFREDDARLGLQPMLEPVAAIVDGPWPAAPVQLAPPFGFRGRRLVQIEVRPFRYDEATGRTSAPLTLTVRVDFNRPAGAAAMPTTSSAPDRHVDAVLETSVLNWQQGSGWRVLPSEQVAGGPLRFGRRPAGNNTAQVFDESQPEVRVQLDESALYRFDADQLLAKGYPAGVPVADVSVHRHEFVEGTGGGSPPYVTIEMPSEVEDQNGNGTLDSGDSVWLWARSWAERSNASNYRRWWGDGEVVYVTRKAGGGLRVPQRAGWNNVAGLTPVASYPFTKHYERDVAPLMQFISSVADTNIGLWQWTDQAFYYSRPDTIRITVNDIDTSRAGSMTTRFVGRKFDSHFMWAGLRNASNQITTVIDSVFWFGKSAVTRTATFRGSALSEGSANFYRHWGKNAFGQPNPATNFFSSSGLDWFDLTYWRRFNAAGDYVRFNSADAAGDIQIHMDNFGSDSVRVYDVTNPEQPVRIAIDPAHVTAGATLSLDFQDVVTSGRREYVAASQLIPADAAVGPKSPPPSAYGRVTRRNLYANLSGDYLLVYPEAFASVTGALATLRRSQGLSVIEAPIESIYDEFGDGRHSAHALQRFARYAYNRWSTRFLLMAGNGTLDPKNARLTSATDWIPVLPSPGPVGTGEGLEIIPSDNRYGFITGADDPISGLDSNRVVPELMVGRLTANNLTDLTNTIAKIIGYEDLSKPDAWRRNVLLNADDAFSGDTFFGGGSATSGYCHRSYEELFVGLNNTMQRFIQSDSGVAGMNVEQFNLRSYILNANITFDPVNGDTCRVSRDDTRQSTHAGVTPILLGKLNSGQFMWNYQGHANEYLLTHEDMYLGGGKQDALRLQNDDKPFFFTAFSCHANMFARPETEGRSFPGSCIGSDLIALPNGRGAIGSWASASFEVVPRNDRDHVNVELIRSMFVFPPRDEFLGADDRGSRVVLGEVILSALFRYLGTTQTYQPERGLSISYTLLGDPATRMSIGRPFNLITANGGPVPSGAPLRLHSAGNTLRLDADLVSNVRLDSLALFQNTGSGDVAVALSDYSVTPAFPDTANGGTFGGRHFRIVYTTQPLARNIDYIVMVKDRNGLVQRNRVTLRLDGLLRSGGTPINDNDEVSPSAALSLLLLSPRPVASPLTELTLTVNGQPQAFTASPVASDTTSTGAHSQREWVLSWAHPNYAIDNYDVQLSVQGGGSVTRRFRVTGASGQLAVRDLIPFPNPFDNSGTNFSFTLLGGEDADVKVHVFTTSGRSIYTNVVRGLTPGYHQFAWDGKDAEGDELANGVYFFRLSATTTSGSSTQQLGRLVKLRRPRRIVEPVIP